MIELIHKTPCPRSVWYAPTGKAHDVCACPDGWPRYDEEIMKTKTTTHTPGPWRVGNFTTHGVGIFTGDLQTMIADTGGYDKQDRSEVEANARLIAAAPDLLEAAQAFTRWLDTPAGETPASRKMLEAAAIHARAAIAKAEGREVP